MNKEKVSVQKNAILNVIKQCSGIIFPLITYPYLFRVLGVLEMGRFSFADSIIAYSCILAMLGVPSYAVREGARVRDDHGRFEVFAGEMLTLSMISCTVSIIVTAVSTLIFQRLSNEYVLIAILSVNMVISAIGRDWINAIYEEYFYLTVRFVVFHLIGVILIFLLVRSPEDIYVYAIISVISSSGALLLNIHHTKKYANYLICKLHALKKHIKPILYLFFVSMAVKIYVVSDITVLGFEKGDYYVGIYSLVSKVYLMVKALFNAIIVVTIPRLSNYLGNHEDDLFTKTLNRVKTFLFSIIVPAVVGMLCLSKEIIIVLGGEEYIEGVRALQLLAVSLLFAVFSNFYANAILVPLRKEKLFAIATGISAVINLLLNIIFIRTLGIEGAALSTIISELFVMIFCWYYSGGVSGKIKIMTALVALCNGIGVLLECMVVKHFIDHSILRLVVCVLVGGIFSLLTFGASKKMEGFL